MPKYAVMTFMFKGWWKDGRMSHELMLKGFADAGAHGVEPFHRDFVEDPGLLPRYRRALQDAGMRTACVDIMCNLALPAGPQRKQEQEQLQRGLDIAAELGADIAHAAGHKLVGNVAPADGRKWIAEGMAEVRDVAAQANLTLAIEDFNPSPTLVCAARDCLEIMDLSGGVVQFVFDTGNFIASKERADENFDLLADRICHCHFKDFKPDASVPAGYVSCDLGKGTIPNAAVASRLLERKYDGWIALETYGRSNLDPVSAVQLEMPVLKGWFGGDR
jgi:sugar phosphate isomerase/epimerase